MSHDLPRPPEPGRHASRHGEPHGPTAEPPWRRPGPCAESQADGVPCPERGLPCEQCARALTRPDA